MPRGSARAKRGKGGSPSRGRAVHAMVTCGSRGGAREQAVAFGALFTRGITTRGMTRRGDREDGEWRAIENAPARARGTARPSAARTRRGPAARGSSFVVGARRRERGQWRGGEWSGGRRGRRGRGGRARRTVAAAAAGEAPQDEATVTRPRLAPAPRWARRGAARGHRRQTTLAARRRRRPR